MIKKRISSLSIFIILLIYIFSAFSYSQTELEKANFIASKGIIENNSTNPSRYRLGDSITRKETMKIIMNLSGIDIPEICNGKFSDVSNDWGCRYIEKALVSGFVSRNTYFRPNDSITKIEVIKLILKAKGIGKIQETSNWQKDYIETAYKEGIIDKKYTDYNTVVTRGWIFYAIANTYNETSNDGDTTVINKKCGDGICDSLEKNDANLCPSDCDGNNDNSGNDNTVKKISDIDTSYITTKYLDISYSRESNAQKLDIYLPDGDGPFPVIIAVHGGAFVGGSKSATQMNTMVKSVKQGYAVVSIDYRLAGEAIFPAAINDVQKAIVYIKENASKYKLNSEKIALWGSSAGGNLVSLAGTKGSKTDNTDVQAVVDRFGPINFGTMQEEFEELGQKPVGGVINNETRPESEYLGVTIGTPEAEKVEKESNPTTYISINTPPFLIQHGTADKNIPITQSLNFYESLKEVIGQEKVTFDKIEGGGHGGELFVTEENLNRIYDFLDKYLK